ncbi:hypothetical protein PVAG01_10386 [Phlyctema vagabunda]|uniref:Uncharacterized protein n=1 Tax=Phlyctema vagabunda TaxID=108571 RepID=A0ABR4P5S2_9HELO
MSENNKRQESRSKRSSLPLQSIPQRSPSTHGDASRRSSKRYSLRDDLFPAYADRDGDLFITKRSPSRQSHRHRRTSSAVPKTRHASRDGASASQPENIPLKDLAEQGPKTRRHSNTHHQHNQQQVQQQRQQQRQQQEPIRGRTELTLKENPYIKTYSGRIISSETVDLRIPSSSGLPVGWSTKNDRFIAYLATHAPLVNGKIPHDEISCERYSLEHIAKLCRERFPKFKHYVSLAEAVGYRIVFGRISVASIENRLAILDLGENNYFKAPYGCYRHEPWGEGI